VFKQRESNTYFVKFSAGTGQATANAIVQCLEDWKLSDKVVDMSFNTTCSNTGSALDACTILQQKLRRPLLHFVCRHYILASFTCFGPSAGPDIATFKRFQSGWIFFNQSKFEPMMPGDLDAVVGGAFFNCKVQVMSFCIQKLQFAQPRDNYGELLELTIDMFGACPPRGVKFIQPGALLHARWMAHMIYVIKTYLFEISLD